MEVLRGRAFEKWLPHEGGVFVNDIRALNKGPHSKKASTERLSLEYNQAGTLIPDFQPPELWGIKFYCL